MGDTAKVTAPLSGAGLLPDPSFTKSQQINPQQLDPLRPAYQGLSGDLATYGQTLVGRQANPYGGSFTAPMSSGEMNIMNLINGMAPTGGDGMSQLPFGSQMSPLISSILSGQNFNPSSNPYLGNTINYMSDQSQRALGGNLNLLDAAFGRAGMTGPSSGRSVQAIQAGRQSNQDLTGQISSMLGQNYQQGLNNQMTMLGQVLPTMNSQNQNFLFNALGANALPRTIQQSGLSSQYQDYLNTQNQTNMYTQIAQQILGGAPGYQFMNPQYAPSQLSQILGGLGSIGQAARPMMMS